MNKIVTAYGIVICSGGGNSLTQSFPTVYHTFHSKIICKDEADAARWTEVTEAEAEALRAKDAELRSYGVPDAAYLARVQKLFGMRWRKGPGSTEYYEDFVGYDAERGFFWFGTMQDISKLDMDIALGAADEMHDMIHHGGQFIIPGLRFIAIPLDSQSNYMLQSSPVEELMLEGRPGGYAIFISGNVDFLRAADKLRKVHGVIKDNGVGANKTISFYRDAQLVEVYITDLTCNVDLQSSGKISMDCIEYMIDNAANTSTITVTLHPEAYARITDELFALAAEKNITIAST